MFHRLRLGLLSGLSLLLIITTACFSPYSQRNVQERWYIDELERRAEAGDPWAQNSLGYCYVTGTYVSQDAEKAFQWYEKAAENDHPAGKYNLSLCYLKGEGTEKDLGKAVRYFQESANQGFSRAEFCLGMLLLEGVGVVTDRDKAKYWLQKAAGQGIREAMYILGNLYLDEDETKALFWIRRAAHYGLPEAQYHYGYLFREGLLVERDRDMYIRWINKAERNGYASSRYGEYYAGRYLLVLTQMLEPVTDKTYLLYPLEEQDIDSESKALYQQGFNSLFNSNPALSNQEAINCLIRSTIKGNKSAKILLSYCYVTGTGVLPDPSAASFLFVGKGKIKYPDSGGTTTIDFEIFNDGSFSKSINWKKE